MDSQSKEFKALQKQWDKRLKDSGFTDIEDRSSGALKMWSMRFVRGEGLDVTMKAKEQYYRAVGHFLHDYDFPNRTERRIWTLHGEGMSIRNIVKTLTKERLWFVKGGTPHRRAVHETLQKLTKTMMAQIEKDNISD